MNSTQSNSEMMNTIDDFNKKLVDEKIDLPVRAYIEVVNEMFYNIDIKFMNDFMDLVDKDECCIPHDKLETYAGYKFYDSNDVLKLLEKLEIEKSNIRYECRKLSAS